MSWGKIITLIVAIALVVGGGVWAYRLYQAPEHIDAITEKWEGSGHADAASEAFVHWDVDEPPEVPVNCAKCHSLYGYHDWLGVDGSALRQVDAPARVGSVLYCNACHNEVGHTLTSVVFPGGAEIPDLGREANCMRCHQGRQSTSSVDATLAGLDDDTVFGDLAFINVHYAVGAGTRMGSEAAVGYQYAGKTYVDRYPHVSDFDACIECHDPHSTAIDPATCEPCHSNVVDYSGIFAIREDPVDYDGDGDVEEGILAEISALHDTLYDAIQAYAADVVGTPIIYTRTFPYWGIDTNGNGAVDDGEAGPANRYATWTPRLVRATYVYHYVVEDPGGFTHNAEYILQMIYDAAEDLGTRVPVDLSVYTRP